MQYPPPYDARYARAWRGQRAYAKQPRIYGSNVTLLSGLRLEGMTAALGVEGSVTTAVFESYVQQVWGQPYTLATASL
jgi:hypothetical protein